MLWYFLIKIFKTHHQISYSLDKKKISINEEYIKNKDDDYYLLSIKIKNKEFLYDADNKFHKKKQIVKKVKTYTKDNILCIYPVLIDNSVLDIECNIDNKLYSYTSVKDQIDLKKLTKSIKAFNNEKYKNDIKETNKYNDITIYNNNLEKNENILIYNYKELIKIKKNSNERIKFSDFDIYNNNMGTLINNLYLVPKYSKKPEISSYYIIDIVKNKTYEIKLKDKLSTNIYVNGVVDNKLYIFDKSNIVQYVINPKTRKIEKAGDKTSIKYYDGKWIDYNPYEYVKKELKFNYIEEKIDFDYKQIYQTSKYYYYYDSDNNFYKVYKNNLKKPILLFNQKDIKEISIINDKVYFLNKDTLYRYDEYGIKNILKRKEINYNSKNIYSVYFE